MTLRLSDAEIPDHIKQGKKRNGKEKEVHRGIIRDRYLARSIKRLRSIRIPTGETMFLKVREMRPGEPERVGLMMYGSLIRDYAKFGIMNTRDL